MTTKKAKRKAVSYPVAPSSVYVWRGFRSKTMSQADFAGFLGSVFVPACALLQPRIGLRAYVPTMVPQEGKSEAVPDQTALMFWARPESHDEAKKAIAERIYTNLHGDVYDMARSKLPEVPVAISADVKSLVPEQPYHLLTKNADWMRGTVYHLVGARKPDLQVPDFLAAAARFAVAFREKPPPGVDGALVCCGNDYLVAWVHSPKAGALLEKTLSGLANLHRALPRQNGYARLARRRPLGRLGGPRSRGGRLHQREPRPPARGARRRREREARHEAHRAFRGPPPRALQIGGLAGARARARAEPHHRRRDRQRPPAHAGDGSVLPRDAERRGHPGALARPVRGHRARGLPRLAAPPEGAREDQRRQGARGANPGADAALQVRQSALAGHVRPVLRLLLGLPVPQRRKTQVSFLEGSCVRQREPRLGRRSMAAAEGRARRDRRRYRDRDGRRGGHAALGIALQSPRDPARRRRVLLGHAVRGAAALRGAHSRGPAQREEEGPGLHGAGQSRVLHRLRRAARRARFRQARGDARPAADGEVISACARRTTAGSSSASIRAITAIT